MDRSSISQPPEPTTKPCMGAFAIRDGFSSEQQAHIEVAMIRWNSFIGREVLRNDSSADCVIQPGHLDGYVGFHANGVITIDLAQAPTDGVWFQHLVMHEIGHVLGLEHVASGVMAENNLKATPDFTDDDLVECRRVGVCL